MNAQRNALNVLDDCLRLKSEIHLMSALQLQKTATIYTIRQLVGLSVASRLCRAAVAGSVRAQEDREPAEVFTRASEALFSEDAPVFTQAMINACAEKGARHTLPIHRIIPIARRMLRDLIPIVSIDMTDGSTECQGHVIMPWRFVNGLVQVSRQAVKSSIPDALPVDEFATRVRADIESWGVERATRWIESTYGDTGFIIPPIALASAAILSNERDLFGEAKSTLEVVAGQEEGS